MEDTSLAGVEYTHGYYRELSPPILRLACISAGFVPPRCDTYLELGFGQGLSLAIHAAANDGQFWGNDFNPAHVENAKSLGASAVILGDSFAELVARPDLPDFDVIALHGVWSWVSDESRRTILDLIRRKLRSGGLVSVSYNCLTGWAPLMPLRHLIAVHAREMPGLPLDQAREAIALARRINAIRPLPEFDKIAAADPAYIVHEFLPEGWSPFGSADVARWMASADLDFVASAELAAHIEAINVPAEGRQLIAELPAGTQQTVRDILAHQKFRKDIFIRAPRRLSDAEQVTLVRQQRFALSARPEDVPLRVETPLGVLGLKEEIYRPLLQSFAAAGFVTELGTVPLPLPQAFEAARILTGAGVLHPAQVPSAAIRERCAALNRLLDSRPGIDFRASPITGGGLYVRAHQIPAAFDI